MAGKGYRSPLDGKGDRPPPIGVVPIEAACPLEEACLETAVGWRPTRPLSERRRIRVMTRHVTATPGPQKPGRMPERFHPAGKMF